MLQSGSATSSPQRATRPARLAELCFWGSVGTLAYTFAIFPVVVMLRGLLLDRPYRSEDRFPSVSVILAVRNEQRSIGPKLQNISALDYPADRVQVIVASDGSEDQTADIVARDYPEVVLLRLPRNGKDAAIAAATAAASGDILVMTDANSTIARGSLRALMRPFADRDVGGVAGDQHYTARFSDERVGGERAYWHFDRLLKRAGSRGGSTVAATGAFYAIRRSLFRPIPRGVNDDYFLSASVVLQGHRLVHAPEAVTYKPTSGSLSSEFKRKVRLMTRGFRTEWELRPLFNPARYGFYAVQFASQKFLRRAACVPLIVLLGSSAAMGFPRRPWRLVAVAQGAFYIAGFVAWLVPERVPPRWRRAFAVPGFFTMSTVAASVALWNGLRGRVIDRWEPDRGRGD
jgi:cellulose synthase/poly-beta-1,6-N-acetylglucosamine synthase-like glycosyltransferase